MSSSSRFDGSFYDADYFERGRSTGKGWLMNYHWMPRRTFKEAFAFIDYLPVYMSYADGFAQSHYASTQIIARMYNVTALKVCFTLNALPSLSTSIFKTA